MVGCPRLAYHKVDQKVDRFRASRYGSRPGFETTYLHHPVVAHTRPINPATASVLHCPEVTALNKGTLATGVSRYPF